MMAITATTSIVTKAMGNAIASTVPSTIIPSASVTACVGSCGTTTVSTKGKKLRHDTMCLVLRCVPKSARHPIICILIQGGLLVQVRGRIRMDFAPNPEILNSIGLSCVALTRKVLTVCEDERYIKM